MKVSFFYGLIASRMISLTHALPCGGFMGNCLKERDQSLDYKHSLKEQAEVWIHHEGYYIYEQYYYDGDGNPIYFRKTSDGTPVKSFPAIGFANFTVEGSRVYRHRYDIFHGMEDGDPSVATASDAFETSTRNRDGSSLSLGSLLGFSINAAVIDDVGEAVTRVVDSRTLQKKGVTKGGLVRPESLYLTETYECLDDDCNQMTVVIQEFESLDDGVQNRKAESFLNMRKVSKDSWVEEFNQALDDYNVVPEFRVEMPMQGTCITGPCNTSEEFWCQFDPECSGLPPREESPMTRSDCLAPMLAWGFILATMALYSYRLGVGCRRKKYRSNIARVFIAETGKSFDELTPATLQSLFDRIRMGSDEGIVSIETLKTFLASGKSDQVPECDLMGLIKPVSPENCTLNFLQFCAFIASLKVQYNTEFMKQAALEDELRKLQMVA